MCVLSALRFFPMFLRNMLYSGLDVSVKQSGGCMIHSESPPITQLQTHSTRHNTILALCLFSKTKLT